MTVAAAEYAALLARAAPYLRRPAEVGEVDYGRVAVTADPWLRAAAEPYLQEGLPELPLSYDEQVDALVQALEELAAELAGVGLRRAWDPAKHPRGPDGRFLSTVDSLKDAIRKHRADGRDGDPLGGFDREQLRRAAKARGITLARGEDRESIAAKLLADLDTAPKTAAPARTSRHHRDLDSVADMERTVETVPVAGQEELSGGAMGDVNLVFYEDGQEIVRKEALEQYGNNTVEMQADAEQLSSLVARALGIQAPRVYRSENDPPSVVHMEYVKDGDYPEEDQPDALQYSDEGHLMALVDTLTLNGDRHPGNWFKVNGRIVPIDNGLAFDAGYFGGLRPGWKVPIGFFSEADMDEVKRRLEELKPDFEQLGQADWHTGMMNRLHRTRVLGSPNGPPRLPAPVP